MKSEDVLENVKETVKGFANPQFIIKHWWVWALILITVFAFWTRSIPAKYGELQALDPFYAYRMNVYMLEHNLQLPEYDHMRYWPTPVHISSFGPLVYFYVPVILYLIFTFFGISMPFLNFAILYPAIMGTVSVFVIFWIGKEIFKDNKAGLFAAMFLATMPAYISRTSAGFFDKEATGGTFLLLAVYTFIVSYKRGSWTFGALSGVFVFLAMGSWGGGQFFIYFVAGFLIIKLLLNQYKEPMIKSAVPSLIAAVLTQRYYLGVTGWSFEQMLALFAVSLIVIRFASGRYKLVKEDQMPYLIPAILIIAVVVLLVGSMFSDFIWSLLSRFLELSQLGEKGHIASTVAEQMSGTWNDLAGRTNIAFSYSLIPAAASFETIFSVWFLMLLGSCMIVYNVYAKRQWLLLLPLLWLAMSIQTVYFMVRLVFFLGPPAALVAGYFLSESLNIFSRIGYVKSRKGLKRLNVLSIPVVAVLSFLILTNLATGYVFCNSVGPSYNSAWDQAMTFLSDQTPVNSSVLSWWDFGYWFQTKGNRPSTADGGNINGSVNEHIADWYTADAQNWSGFRPWLKGIDASYILMDYTLPGKYGAISKIASRGDRIIGLLQMQRGEIFPQENKTIVEFKAGQYTVWMPVGDGGSIVSAPIFMVSQGGQYVGRTYITDICDKNNGIVRMPTPGDGDIMPGCLAISAYGLFYIPPEAEFSIFTNLMFMDGYGLPDVDLVFDNDVIKIYKLEVNESASF